MPAYLAPYLALLFLAGIAGAIVAFLWLLNRDANRYLRRHGQAGPVATDGARPCIVCGYDLRASPEICPECGFPLAFDQARAWLNETALRRDWPADSIAPRPPALGEKLVFAHVAPSTRQADLLKNQLMARGVWCEVRQSPDDYFVVLVPAIDEPSARAIIDRFRSSACDRSMARPARD